MSPQVYLHHYPASLFSEKIRVMLGYLGVPWRSVEIASIMPRPLLMPLTGGYRKTPTLQIGANVYCDTAVITTGLVRHTGDKTLYAPGFLAHRVAEWADSTLFRVVVAMNFRPEAIGAFMNRLSAEEVAAFQADRAELAAGAPIVSVPPDSAITTFAAYLNQLEGSLQASYLFGDAPSIADFSVYHCLWFVGQNPVNAAFLEPYPAVGAWMSRMAAFGHGDVTDASAQDALEHAAANEPELPSLAALNLPGLAVGDEVTVSPTDYGRTPVAGRLVAASSEEIVLERETPETGRLMTHFPNIGFHITPA
ncbi:MAG: glutathione S-transferase family protein [Pseudomonadales bacterium]|jgi:glutathione S-transferase